MPHDIPDHSADDKPRRIKELVKKFLPEDGEWDSTADATTASGNTSARLHDATAHVQLKRPSWKPGDRPITEAMKYRICNCGNGSGMVGEGLQGSVWAAEDDSGNRVAIKFVCLDHRERVTNVLAILRRLDPHPNVIQVIAGPYNLPDGLAVIMPLATQSLFAYVQQRTWRGDKPIDERLLALMRGAAQGIDFLNDNGIRHRDIKPANLLEFSDGRVVVGDPDLLCEASKAITPGSWVGTPGHIAAETDDGYYTSRSDQVGLAATYVTLRTGSVDGTISDPVELAIVDKARNADPFRRHESCTKFVDELWKLATAIPEFIQAELNKGDELEGECKYAEAAAAYEVAVTLASSAGSRRGLLKARIELAEALILQGESFDRAKQLLNECVTDLKADPDQKSRSTALHLLGHMAICEGRIQDGKSLCGEALANARSCGDRFQEGLFLVDMGHAEEMSGNLPEAHRLFDEAANIFRVEYRESTGKEKAKACINLAGALSMKAKLFEHEGKADEMLACLSEAEELFRSSDHPDNLARCLVLKVKALFTKSKWKEGMEALDEASSIFERIDSIHWLLRCYEMRARLAFQMNDQKAALAVSVKAISVAAERGSPEDHVRMLGQTAALCRRNEMHDAAANLHAEAKRVARQQNLTDVLVDLLLDEAAMRHRPNGHQDDDDGGKRLVHEALSHLESLLVKCQVKGRRAHYMSRIGELNARLGNLTEARSSFEQALRIFEEIGDAGGVADGLAHLAAAARADGDTVEAIRLMEALLERSKGKPLHHFHAGAHHDLVRLKMSQGDLTAARKHFDAARAICASYPMPDVEEALAETEQRLEVAERSLRPTPHDLPTMLRELHAWKDRYPDAACAILPFWYHCFMADLWSNCRSQFGVKLLVHAASTSDFESFVEGWQPLGDLFVYGASFTMRSARGVDLIPWMDEMRVPPHLKLLFFKGKAPQGGAGAKALIKALEDIPYFMTFFSGPVEPFPDAKAFIIGRRYRLPDEIYRFMLGHNVETLISRRMLTVLLDDREDDTAFIHDMLVAWETRMLPVFFGSLPNTGAEVSLHRTMRLELPRSALGRGADGSVLEGAKKHFSRFMAEVDNNPDLALANLADGLRDNMGNSCANEGVVSLQILRFKAGLVEVYYPALVVPA